MEKKNNDSKFLCSLFFFFFFFGDFSSPDFAVSGSVLLGGQIGTTGSLEPCPICVNPAKPAQSE